MYRTLSLFVLFAIGATHSISAQSTTYIGPDEGSFHVASHWSEGFVPGTDPDFPNNVSVIIPAGFTVVSNQDILMDVGYIHGPGTFVNNGNLFLSSNSALAGNHSMSNDLTFENNGNIELDYIDDDLNSGQLGIDPSVTFNNNADGVIKIVDFGIAAPTARIFNNGGTIIKTGSADIWIQVRLTNNGGTIHVQEGILHLTHYLYPDFNYFNSGTYLVDEGATFELFSKTEFSGVFTGDVQGGWQTFADWVIPGTVTMNFTGEGISMNSGLVTGGGVLTNEGQLNFTNLNQQASKSLEGGTTVVNHGTIDFKSGSPGSTNGNMSIRGGALLQNMADGVLDFSFFGINTQAIDLGLIQNDGGTINKVTNSTELIVINCPFINNGGTIDVAEGELRFQTPTSNSFDAGNYFIAENAEIRLQDTCIFSGILQGQNLGTFNLVGKNKVNGQASNDIVNGMSMPNGSWHGSGEFTNNTDFHFLTNGSKIIHDDIQFRNTGELYVEGTAQYFQFNDNTGLVNEENGVIHLQSMINSLDATQTFVNNGTILKPVGASSTLKITTINNGVIDIPSEQLYIDSRDFINNPEGIVTGAGTLRHSDWNMVSNNGTFSPGPGSQQFTAFLGYVQHTDGVLEVDLEGLVPITEYDQLFVQGNATIDGDIIVHLDFAPQLDDEFVVIDASGTVVCNDLVSSTTAVYEDLVYTFEVICNTDNVTLKMTSSMPVGLDEIAVSDIMNVYPNPMQDFATIELSELWSGSSDALVTIFNAYGQQVSTVKVSGTEDALRLDRTVMSSGLYFLHLHVDGKWMGAVSLVVE